MALLTTYYPDARVESAPVKTDTQTSVNLEMVIELINGNHLKDGSQGLLCLIN